MTKLQPKSPVLPGRPVESSCVQSADETVEQIHFMLLEFPFDLPFRTKAGIGNLEFPSCAIMERRNSDVFY